MISVGSEVQILPGPPIVVRCQSPGVRFRQVRPVGLQPSFPMTGNWTPTTVEGGVAQLGEHLLCKQGVVGSNPIVSTNGWRGIGGSITRSESNRYRRCLGEQAALAVPFASPVGGAVLCQGESGSGASLGAAIAFCLTGWSVGESPRASRDGWVFRGVKGSIVSVRVSCGPGRCGGPVVC